MALTVLGVPQTGVIPGMPGKKFQAGMFTFTTTSGTGELPMLLQGVHSIVLTAIGTPATDEVLSVDESALAGDGRISVPATGTITCIRTGASKTPGLKVAYFAIGE